MIQTLPRLTINIKKNIDATHKRLFFLSYLRCSLSKQLPQNATEVSLWQVSNDDQATSEEKGGRQTVPQY